jgi:NAD(P)H-dependent FMN reductase
VKPFDGYIFVSPEYNFGIAGGVKNAIDYLYHEWIGKPVFIVTYGTKGGNHSSDNLKTTHSGIKLRVIETRPQLKFCRT